MATMGPDCWTCPYRYEPKVKIGYARDFVCPAGHQTVLVLSGLVWSTLRSPQEMSAKEMRPVGAEEYATTLITVS
jgi:hypothetical protein